MANKQRYSILIDTNACIACGLCAELAPKIFTSDAQMKSVVLENPEIDLDTLMNAAQSCPTGAITVIDTETGEKLWPK